MKIESDLEKKTTFLVYTFFFKYLEQIHHNQIWTYNTCVFSATKEYFFRNTQMIFQEYGYTKKNKISKSPIQAVAKLAAF